MGSSIISPADKQHTGFNAPAAANLRCPGHELLTGK
jgi:hypothetical protein